ncbi:hypothetical protein Glove_130g11 [Diversispora epigaea]|uniref:L-dopachrome isomerase n=1 Tax=Diversispora epigaea TaxID=1348612 RepID=A0A397J855_9GLOM|nr:hypothetical protein Glove_130g11 [Diversispora epigaea]
MPVIEVKTNVKVQNHHEFLTELSTLIADLLDRTVAVTWASLEDCKSLYFASNNDPAYIVRVKSVFTIDLEHNKETSKKLSEFFYNKLGAPNDRGIIFFADPGKENCGWNGTTLVALDV